MVLFVVQPGERNIMDQRLLEHAVTACAAPGGGSVHVRRMTLAQLHRTGRLRDGDGALVVPHEAAELAEQGGDGGGLVGEPGVEVSVVYFRCGYTPDDYPTEDGACASCVCVCVCVFVCVCVCVCVCTTR